MKTRLIVVFAALMISSAGTDGKAQNAVVPANPTEALIWSQEQKIYEGRAHGSIQYYVDHTSPDYLTWPASTDHPIDKDALKKGTKSVAAGHEVIKSELTNFAQDGDTAVIYYINHRTMRPDGTAVDERYANIHVWIKRNGAWVILGGMSRLIPH